MYRESFAEDRSVIVCGIDGRIVGFHVASGERLFEHRVGIDDVELWVHHDRIYAITQQRVLHFFRYPSGEPAGEVALPGTSYGRPSLLISGGRLFVGSSGDLVCLNLDGAVLWHEPLSGTGPGALALALPDVTRTTRASTPPPSSRR